MYLPGTISSGLRGLGAVPCSSVSVAPGFVGPVDCDPSGGPVNYTPANPNQTSLLDPFGWFGLDQGRATGVMQASGSPASTGTGTFSGWLNANALNVGLAVAAAALLIGLSKR